MDNELYARLRALFGIVLVLSLATLATAAVIGSNSQVWVRGTIVAVIAVLLLVLARRAHAGSRGAYIRMRVMSTVAPIAVLAIVAIPHDGFPGWMKVEQGVVGALLAAAAVLLGRRSVRAAFAKSEPAKEPSSR
jgi:hypothetical protein